MIFVITFGNRLFSMTIVIRVADLYTQLVVETALILKKIEI